MNYLTVKPEGELHVFEGPEEPGYCTITGCTPTEVCGCRNRKQQHEQAMLTASQSSVRCKDQQQARKIICDNYTYFNKPGAFYPLPEGVRVEFEHKEIPCPDGIEGCEVIHLKRVAAILTFENVGAVEDKQESQEELIVDVIRNFFTVPDPPDVPESIINRIKSKFTITRKEVN